MKNTNQLPNYTNQVANFYAATEGTQKHIVLKITGMLTDGTLIGWMEVVGSLPSIYGWGSPHVVLISERVEGWRWKRLTLGRELEWQQFV
jgi:hypothetical protein